MSHEFRYSLTRICLRTGQLSLSPAMAKLFPDEGKVRAFDTIEDEEFELVILGPRTVGGLGEYFARHRLRVNDTVRLRALPDSGVALTAVARARGDRERNAAVSGAAGARNSAERTADRRNESRTVADKGAAAARNAAPAEASAPGADAAPRERTSPRFDAEQPRSPSVTPYPRGVMFPGEAALNSKRPEGDRESVERARQALREFGLAVEGLPRSLLLARASLGRRNYNVLMRVLGPGERPDWAELLAFRRQRSADYLAVCGDHRDLHRLSGPAELAGATLWSWQGIERVLDLAERMPLGPLELEPHFARMGMFDEGLARFEESIGRLLEERGELSTVLARLARLKAPAVFVLDDLLPDPSGPSSREGTTVLGREKLVRVLELLERPPFQLVGKIDSGEYFLRHPVATGLDRLSDYALSLKENLPTPERVLLTSRGEPDAEKERVAPTDAIEEAKQT